MAKRGSNLANLNLSDTGKPTIKKDHAAGKKANTIRLDPELWRLLNVYAAELNTKRPPLVDQAIREWMERNPLPKRG